MAKELTPEEREAALKAANDLRDAQLRKIAKGTDNKK